MIITIVDSRNEASEAKFDGTTIKPKYECVSFDTFVDYFGWALNRKVKTGDKRNFIAVCSEVNEALHLHNIGNLQGRQLSDIYEEICQYFQKIIDHEQIKKESSDDYLFVEYVEDYCFDSGIDPETKNEYIKRLMIAVSKLL